MSRPYVNNSIPRRSGFTLIELLVVVTIIVALLAIALPSMGRAFAFAEVGVCQSNLRQIGMGTYTYAQDYLGTLPDCWKFASDIDWDGWRRPIGSPSRIAPSSEGPGGLLFPYLNSEEVFLCPTFEQHAGSVMPANHRAVISYAMHESFKWGGDWQGLAIRRVTDQYVQPSRQLMIADEAPYTPTAVANHPINNTCLGVSRSSNPADKIDGVATYHLTDDPTLQTGNGDVLFLDGHAELREMKESIDVKVLAYPVDFPPQQWLD